MLGQQSSQTSTFREMVGSRTYVNLRTYCNMFAAAVVAVGLAASASAVTIHRSFRTREAGVGFGSGTAGVVYPVDSKVAAALDEAAEKDAAKTKVIIGKCTRVSDGDTIHVVTDGNVKFKVRLDRIDAPEKDQPYGKESTAYLTSLIRGKTVRVEWVKKDQYGRVLGIVYLDKTDVNLQMVSSGNAWHYSYLDKTPAYIAAEAAAKEQRLGLWAAENPIDPYKWRKAKRKM